MNKKLFSKEEINKLSENKYVKSVSENAITYTDEFKLLFIGEYERGKNIRQIFEGAGFDIEILGIARVKQASYRWRKMFKSGGVTGLEDKRSLNSGRPINRELTMEENLAKKDAEIEYLKAELEFIKKLEWSERQVKKGKLQASKIFGLIKGLIYNFNLTGMVRHLCKIANVSTSGYYRFLKTKDYRDIKEDRDIKSRDIILKAFNHRGYKRGSRSIKMTLENEFGIKMNRKKIQRIMRKYNIICPIRKANTKKRMMKATQEHRVVPNMLNRKFKQKIPGKVLLTDITYMPYGSCKMAYLSTIKDSSTNEILAYNLSNSLAIDIVTKTIDNLINLKSFKLHKDAFVHSDQGAHYTSPIFQKLLKKYNLGQSMSRKGNCWDNAPQESFFGHMKDEIDYKSCNTLEELQFMVDNYMDYYNNYRCQWNLKKLTPNKYRSQLLMTA
ncbi:IS3 family transposase [Terrisporobacter vanillatitrophus]|uniref:IS3 family transposase n=1 Tax=Terrisporobacter vanillatitrophus TaxID=3058402 RepID=UPI0033696BDB